MCLFLCDLGDSFILLLVEPIAGENVSPSDIGVHRLAEHGGEEVKKIIR